MIKKGYLLVIAGASLWGLIGIMVQGLYDAGLTPIQVVTVRAVTAALILVLYVYWKDKSLLKIDVRDSVYFIGTGIFSILFFNYSYFVAIRETSLAVAAILLYTAPAFVTLLSMVVFKESFTRRKGISLFLTFIGTILVVEFFPYTGNSLSLVGLLAGIGSALGYALYSIFGKAALHKYHTLTVTTYTFLFTSLATIPMSGLWRSKELFMDGNTWIYIISLGFFPTVLAYLMYTKGLETIEASRASIAATVEPVVAAMVGILLYQERLSPWQIAGILLVILAVSIVQERSIAKKTSRNLMKDV